MSKYVFFKSLLLMLFACFSYSETTAQQFLLDKPVRAGELICFPEVGNESRFYYLPDKIRLAKKPDGKPSFLFIRYVKNEALATSTTNSVQESTEGGGIIHAVIELSVTPKQLEDARSSLTKLYSNAELVGPIIYKSGTVALVSSVAQEGGSMTKKIVGLGNAPILDGQKAAVSIMVNKIGSKLLWETFKTPNPDISFSFQMQVEGYLSPKRVKIEADFEQIYKHQTMEAAVVTPVFAAEINQSFDELRNQGAIKVEQIGEDAQLNQIMQTVYAKLTDLIFDKVGGTGVPELASLAPSGRQSMLDRATGMLERARTEARQENERRGNLRRDLARIEAQARTAAVSRRDSMLRASGRPIPNFGTAEATTGGNGGTAGNNAAQPEAPQDVPMPNLAVAASFQIKTVKQSGKYRIDLNKYTSDARTLRFDENIGTINCPECMVEVNLDDPLMKQREINVVLGVNAEEFGKSLNFVNVLVKKKHENGEETVDEVKIDKAKLNETGNFFRMIYGWKGDNNRANWLKYEYKTAWSFQGGINVETAWKSTDFGSIPLNPPLVKKPVFIDIDQDLVSANSIRGVEVAIDHQVQGKPLKQQISFKTNKEELSRTVELLQPMDDNDFKYDYEVTVFQKGQDPKTLTKKTSKFRTIAIDKL